VVSNLLLAIAYVAVSTGVALLLPAAEPNSLFHSGVLHSQDCGCCTRWSLSFFPNDPSQLDFLHKSLPFRFSMAFLIIGWMAMITVLWYQQQQQKEDDNEKADAEKLNRDAELFTFANSYSRIFFSTV
jgi:hypothetical protein